MGGDGGMGHGWMGCYATMYVGRYMYDMIEQSSFYLRISATDAYGKVARYVCRTTYLNYHHH